MRKMATERHQSSKEATRFRCSEKRPRTISWMRFTSRLIKISNTNRTELLTKSLQGEKMEMSLLFCSTQESNTIMNQFKDQLIKDRQRNSRKECLLKNITSLRLRRSLQPYMQQNWAHQGHLLSHSQGFRLVWPPPTNYPV